jgi:hypothetical protein
VSVFEQISLAWIALWRTLAELRRPALWTPWILLGILQAAVVAALWSFAHPAFSWFMAPLLRRIGGGTLLHYPAVLIRLPELYGQADLVMGAVFGSIAIGAATWMFAQRFTTGTVAVGPGLGRGLARAVVLVLVQLPLNLLLVAAALGIGRLGAGGAAGPRAIALSIAGFVVPVVIQALFLYVAALVMVEGVGVIEAMRRLPRTWARGFWAALFLGFLMLLPLLPFEMVATGSGTIATRGNPDLIGWLTLAQVAAGLFVGFGLSGSATLVYLSGIAERDS